MKFTYNYPDRAPLVVDNVVEVDWRESGILTLIDGVGVRTRVPRGYTDFTCDPTGEPAVVTVNLVSMQQVTVSEDPITGTITETIYHQDGTVSVYHVDVTTGQETPASL